MRERAPDEGMPVLVGTSGWSYDAWKGKVYAPGIPASERLRHYAERFPTVEVDSTYYRDPSRSTVQGWIEKVEGAPRFELSVKVNRKLTHEALVAEPLADVARVAEAWRSRVADPLADAGRLGSILLQLSPAVLCTENALARLDVALSALAPHPRAVEFRNRTWARNGRALDGEARGLLAAHETASVIVDGPPFPPIIAETAPHAYVRFHGRNRALWFKRGGGDRYDHRYTEEELAPWADKVAELAGERRIVRAYFNNHAEGKAFMNAEEFASMLAQRGAPLRAPATAQKKLFF